VHFLIFAKNYENLLREENFYYNKKGAQIFGPPCTQSDVTGAMYYFNTQYSNKQNTFIPVKYMCQSNV